MPKPNIVDSPPDSGDVYFATTKYNQLSQRQTLEATMLALGELLGVKVIKRGRIARGNATIYKAVGSYMSSSNTILDMAEKLLSLEKQARSAARAEKRIAKQAAQAAKAP